MSIHADHVAPPPFASGGPPRPPSPSAADRYIDLLTAVLLREVGGERFRAPMPTTPARRLLARTAARLLAPLGLALVRPVAVDPAARAVGSDLPPEAETMIGRRRMDNVAMCMRDVLARGVPGDVIECGVWRGGATILMRGILAAYGIDDRTVWVADSFQGLPASVPAAASQSTSQAQSTSQSTSTSTTRSTSTPGARLDHRDAVAERVLAVPLDVVRTNFARYGLLDERVRFLPGWFADTLPAAPIAQLAVLRIDADLYASTHDALTALYPRLSPGGWCIIDDYGDGAGCRAAVDAYRAAHGVAAPLIPVDHTGVFWRKGADDGHDERGHGSSHDGPRKG